MARPAAIAAVAFAAGFGASALLPESSVPDKALRSTAKPVTAGALALRMDADYAAFAAHAASKKGRKTR